MYNIYQICVSFQNLLPPNCKQIRTDTIQKLSDQYYSEYQGNNRTIRKKIPTVKLIKKSPYRFQWFSFRLELERDIEWGEIENLALD